MLWLQLSKEKKEIQKLKERLQDRPKDKQSVLRIAHVLYQIGQYEEAKNYFQRLIHLYAEANDTCDDSLAWLRFARCCVVIWQLEGDQRSFQESIQAYEQALGSQQFKNSPQILMELASVHYKLGSIQATVAVLGHVVIRFPRSPLKADAVYACAQMLFLAQRYREAAQYYRDVAVDPPRVRGARGGGVDGLGAQSSIGFGHDAMTGEPKEKVQGNDEQKETDDQPDTKPRRRKVKTAEEIQEMERRRDAFPGVDRGGLIALPAPVCPESVQLEVARVQEHLGRADLALAAVEAAFEVAEPSTGGGGGGGGNGGGGWRAWAAAAATWRAYAERYRRAGSWAFAEDFFLKAQECTPTHLLTPSLRVELCLLRAECLHYGGARARAQRLAEEAIRAGGGDPVVGARALAYVKRTRYASAAERQAAMARRVQRAARAYVARRRRARGAAAARIQGCWRAFQAYNRSALLRAQINGAAAAAHNRAKLSKLSRAAQAGLAEQEEEWRRAGRLLARRARAHAARRAVARRRRAVRTLQALLRGAGARWRLRRADEARRPGFGARRCGVGVYGPAAAAAAAAGPSPPGGSRGGITWLDGGEGDDEGWRPPDPGGGGPGEGAGAPAAGGAARGNQEGDEESGAASGRRALLYTVSCLEVQRAAGGPGSWVPLANASAEEIQEILDSESLIATSPSFNHCALSRIFCQPAALLGEGPAPRRHPRCLVLAGCPVGDRGARALLAAARRGIHLESISLSNANITPEGAKHLAELLSFPDCILRKLCIEDNPELGDAGAAPLLRRAQRPAAAPLRHLALAGAGLTDASAALAGVTIAVNGTLDLINLNRNSLSAKGIRLIIQSLHTKHRRPTFSGVWLRHQNPSVDLDKLREICKTEIQEGLLARVEILNPFVPNGFYPAGSLVTPSLVQENNYDAQFEYTGHQRNSAAIITPPLAPKSPATGNLFSVTSLGSEEKDEADGPSLESLYPPLAPDVEELNPWKMFDVDDMAMITSHEEKDNKFYLGVGICQINL